jgi:hypothetical protein
MKKISSFLIAFLLLSCGNRQSEKFPMVLKQIEPMIYLNMDQY